MKTQILYIHAVKTNLLSYYLSKSIETLSTFEQIYLINYKIVYFVALGKNIVFLLPLALLSPVGSNRQRYLTNA